MEKYEYLLLIKDDPEMEKEFKMMLGAYGDSRS